MAIRWEKFTVKAQEAVQRGNDLASEHGNPELLPLHLLASFCPCWRKSVLVRKRC